jgi:hypothetical protein
MTLGLASLEGVAGCLGGLVRAVAWVLHRALDEPPDVLHDQAGHRRSRRRIAEWPRSPLHAV